ncbi:MAG: hypothetical protein K6L81_11050 [Agarilytica sp.]
MKDVDGLEINQGDLVEILYAIEEGLDLIEPEYAEEIRSAVGQKLKVDCIDEHNRAWVDIERETEDDTRCEQTLFLKSDQIRKVS